MPMNIGVLQLWRDEVVSRNALPIEIADFVASGAKDRFIDRHIARNESAIPGPDPLLNGMLAGYDLFAAWKAVSMGRRDVHVGGPYLFVEVEWLERRPNSPPPHVWVSLCREATRHRDLVFQPDPPAFPVQALAEAISRDGHSLGFVLADDPDSAGVWVVV